MPGRWVCLLLLFLLAVHVPFVPAQGTGKPPAEPMSTDSWPAWSAWLAPRLSEQNLRTMPAFDQARKFLRTQANKQGQLPRSFDGDFAAWLILGDGYLNDPTAKLPQSPLLGNAERALRRSIELNPKSALAHHKLGRVLLRGADQGDNLRPNADSLREADKELKEAYALDPSLPRLSLHDQALLPYWIGDYAAAEPLLREYLKQKPGEAAMARNLGRAIVFNTQRQGPRAPELKALVEQFPNDGVLASLYSYALSLDGDSSAAELEYNRARTLGTEPTRVLPRGSITVPEPPSAGSILWRVRWLVVAFIGFYALVMIVMALTGLLLAGKTCGDGVMELLGTAPDQLVSDGRVIQTAREACLNRF